MHYAPHLLGMPARLLLARSTTQGLLLHSITSRLDAAKLCVVLRASMQHLSSIFTDIILVNVSISVMRVPNAC